MDIHDNYNYVGDRNLEYGGLFIDLSDWKHGYATCVRITDLDSASGFTGAVLIEHIIALGLDKKQPVQEAMRYSGMTKSDLRQLDPYGKRLAVIDALVGCGHYDPDDAWDNYQIGHSQVVQCEPDGPTEHNGWRATVRLKEGQTLLDYLAEAHLRPGDYSKPT